MLVFFAMSASAGIPTWSEITSDSGWKSDSDNSTEWVGSVHVDTRTIQEVPCFVATANTDVAPDKLLEVAADVEGSTRWSSAGVTEASVMSKGDGWEEYYQYLDVPGWTMSSDRFWFLKGTVEKAADTIIFRWERLVDGGDHADKYQAVKAAHPSAIEPPVNTGGWVFKGAAGATQIKYYICTDSGGSIPTMVQNAATRRTLPDTLSDVVKEAKRRMGG